MLKRVLLSIALLAGYAPTVSAQVCGTINRQAAGGGAAIPGIDGQPSKELQEQVAKRVQAMMQQTPPANRSATAVYTIPVVVHIVNFAANEDISDAVVRTQIALLNDYFGKRNTDVGHVANCTHTPKHCYGDVPSTTANPNVGTGVAPRAADVQIEFKLATREEDGDCTTGIVHKTVPAAYAATHSFYPFTNAGATALMSTANGSRYWNPSEYMNIYVTRLPTSPNIVTGYACRPLDATIMAPNGDDFDGVVISRKCFGVRSTTTNDPSGTNDPLGNLFNFNTGRIAAHEVGHYLNLDHIWGIGEGKPGTGTGCTTDRANDTPLQPQYNLFTLTSAPESIYPRITTCNGVQNNNTASGERGDMYMNFMDYGDNNVVNMFTADQKQIMFTTLNTPAPAGRASLIAAATTAAVFGPAPSFGYTGPYCINYTGNGISFVPLCTGSTTRVRYVLTIGAGTGTGTVTFMTNNPSIVVTNSGLTATLEPTNPSSPINVYLFYGPGAGTGYTKTISLTATYLGQTTVNGPWTAGTWSYTTPTTTRTLDFRVAPTLPTSVTCTADGGSCVFRVNVSASVGATQVTVTGPADNTVGAPILTYPVSPAGGSTPQWRPPYVTVTATNACGSVTSNTYNFSTGPCDNSRGLPGGDGQLPIDGVASRTRLTISPNPAMGQVRFLVGGEQLAGLITIKTLAGAVVQSFEVSTAEASFDTRMLREGTYLVEFRNAEQVKHQALVVQH